MKRSEAEAIAAERNLAHDQMIHRGSNLLFGLENECLSKGPFVWFGNKRGNSAGTPLAAAVSFIALPHPTHEPVYVTNVRFLEFDSGFPDDGAVTENNELLQLAVGVAPSTRQSFDALASGENVARRNHFFQGFGHVDLVNAIEN